jgi:hypothetical protein
MNQVIYYVDTPRYLNSRTANVPDRGSLLLFNKNASNNKHKRIEPEKGVRVNFNPFKVVHATGQKPLNAPSVNRKMIILLIYGYPAFVNVGPPVNTQLREPAKVNRTFRTILGSEFSNQQYRLSNQGKKIINNLGNMFKKVSLKQKLKLKKRQVKNRVGAKVRILRKPKVSSKSKALSRARGL